MTATNIDLTSNEQSEFTLFKAEEEVLLLPLFTFQITDVYTSSKSKTVEYKDDNNQKISFSTRITEITLAELPYTDLLEYKKIHESTLIWYTKDNNDQV